MGHAAALSELDESKLVFPPSWDSDVPCACTLHTLDLLPKKDEERAVLSLCQQRVTSSCPGAHC